MTILKIQIENQPKARKLKMFDLHITKNPLNRVTGYTAAIMQGFSRNGITDTIQAFSLMSALANIQPKKSMYIDRVDNCVRIFCNVEYSARLFLKRLNLLKKQLHFLNTPYQVIVEELEPGMGIDFMLLVKNLHVGKPLLTLVAPYLESSVEYVNDRILTSSEYAWFGSYSDVISGLKIAREANDLCLSLHRGNREVDLNRTIVTFDLANSAEWVATGMPFKAITFSEAKDSASMEIIRYGDGSMQASILSELKES